MVWIVVAAIVLGLIYLALVGRALARRMAVLKAEQGGLQATVARAQELARVAEGLQAHAESLQVRAELMQERIEQLKQTRAATKANPGMQ